MAYIEKVKKGKKNFYYLAQTVRLRNKFKKARVFLGKGKIPQNTLKKLARKVEGSLKKEIQEAKKMKKTASDKKLNLTTKKEDFTKVAADLVVLPVFEEEKSNSFIDKLPIELKKEVLDLIKRKSLKGEFGEVRVLNTFGGISAKNILLIGLGKKKELSLEVLRRASATVLKAAKGLDLKRVATTLAQTSKLKAEEVAQAIAEGTLLADYQFDKFKSKKDEKKVENLIILDGDSAAVEKGVTLAEATNYARDLVNLPAAIVTPSYLGKEALKLKNKKTSVKVYGRAEIKKRGMNALLAVGSGSAQEQKFIFIEYKGGGKKKIALVGKGITFDAGGLNLKPTRFIEEMKQDMAGAGAVLGVIKAVQKLDLKVNLLGIIPACENLVGGTAYKPGDILTAYNKKTIEVANTDAEGRLVLADALGFAEKQKPGTIIDVATLTGAVAMALGNWAVGLLSKDDALVGKLVKAGKESGERVWQLPMWDDYKDLVKSGVADVCNSHKGYDAGVIEGGIFLSNFVEKTSFAHLDIGGTAWFNEDKFYFAKGGTGAGVRLLVRFLEKNC